MKKTNIMLRLILGIMASLIIIFIMNEIIKNVLNIIIANPITKLILLAIIDLILLIVLLYFKSRIVLKNQQIESEKIPKIQRNLLIVGYIIVLLAGIFTYYYLNIIEKTYTGTSISKLQYIGMFLIILTILNSFIVLVLEGKWINKLSGTTKEKDKNIKFLYIVAGIIILLEIVGLSIVTIQKNQKIIDIEVFIRLDADAEEIEELRSDIINTNKVENIEYSSKENALRKIKENFKGNRELMNSFEENDILPSSFIVKVKRKNSKEVTNQIEKMPLVEKVNTQSLNE